jgi:hypothetical protein
VGCGPLEANRSLKLDLSRDARLSVQERQSVFTGITTTAIS